MLLVLLTCLPIISLDSQTIHTPKCIFMSFSQIEDIQPWGLLVSLLT